jgi:hypothetical protein
MSSEAKNQYRGAYAPANIVTKQQVENRHPIKSAPFEGNSLYKEEYKNHGLQPRNQPRSSASMMDTGVGDNRAPFEGTTTNKSDYPNHGVVPRNMPNDKNKHGRSALPEDRDFNSEHRQQYDAKPLQPRSSAAPVQSLPPNRPFEGTSTNKSDYPHHVNGRAAIPAIPDKARRSLPEDRDFGSEHRDAYTKKPLHVCPAVPVAVQYKSKPGHIRLETTAPGVYRHKGPI